MINLEEQIGLFKIIGSQLKSKAECIAIGGSAMMFYGTKLTTKDVDLVFLKKDCLLSILAYLKSIPNKWNVNNRAERVR